MAGYELEPKVYNLTFADHPGLKVRTAGLSVRQLLDLARWDEADATEKLLALFASKLISWNLECDGEPVPCDYESILDLDDDLVLEVIGAWQEAVAGVPAPLGGRSPSGKPSPEASPPTGPSSVSPPS